MPRARLLLLVALAGCAPERPRPTPVPWSPPPRGRPAPAQKPPQKPAWTARRIVADAVPAPGGRLHTVKPGETGIAIARAYGVPWDRVVAANNLAPPFVLKVGSRLLLPSAERVAAQSVEDRARAFRIDIDDIITGGEPAVARAAARPPATRPVPGQAQTPTLPGQAPGLQRPAPAPPPLLAADTPDFRWPVDGRILSGFGAKPGGRFNDGVNLKATLGAPVRAAGDGVVAYAGDDIPGFGNLLLIKHAGGWVTAYGHNDALLVARGRKVAKGEVVARAGATGAVSEPQLHFELRRGRAPIDPVRVLGGR